MEHNPVNALYDEHRIISLAEEYIQNLFHTWVDKPAVYETNVKELLSLLSEYADNLHHKKEEGILFPALRDIPEFTLGELLDELEAHHERFRDFIHKIKDDLGEGNYPESYAILKEYCNDLLDHIAVEDDELFVLAESMLSPQEMEKIYFLFEDVDREMGMDRKSEFESFFSKSELVKTQ